MTEITDNKHTLALISETGEPYYMGITEKFLNTAPERWKKLAREVKACCMFLEQFHLAGHFTFGTVKPLSCAGITDLSTDIKDVYKEDDEGYPCVVNTDLPVGLMLTIYAGLVYIMDDPLQYAFQSEKIKYADATEEIGWKDHVVISVEQKIGDNDLIYVIPIYRKEGDFLKSVGSYNAFEEKVVDDNGNDISVTKEVEENFRRVYGKADTVRKVKDLDRNKKGN